MKTSTDLKKRYRLFRLWQQRPYRVAPMSDEQHCCPTCDTNYVGNYCPRCGQSSFSRRFSFKGNLTRFLEEWGFGNRSFLRTIRDLVLRPGYLIRDYLNGMFMAYFPPFKMLLMLAAITLLVSTGFNIKRQNLIQEEQTELEETFSENKTEQEETAVAAPSEKDSGKESADDEKSTRFAKIVSTMLVKEYRFIYDYYSLTTIAWIILLSGPLFWMFRHAPKILGITYSEFFLAMIWCESMMAIFSIVSIFLCIDTYAQFFIMLTPVIPLRQLSGYSCWQTILRYIASYTLAACFIMFLIILSIVGALFYVYFS